MKTIFEKLIGRQTEERQNREFLAEPLESRVLYSASPVEGQAGDSVFELVVGGLDAATRDSGFQSIDHFAAESEPSSGAPAFESIREGRTFYSFDLLEQSEKAAAFSTGEEYVTVALPSLPMEFSTWDAGFSGSTVGRLPVALDQSLKIEEYPGFALGFAENSQIFFENSATENPEQHPDMLALQKEADDRGLSSMGASTALHHEVGRIFGLEIPEFGGNVFWMD